MHFHGAWCRASWEIGRFWAAVSAEGGICPGYLTTPSLEVEGKQLHLNAKTLGSGKIEAELLDESKQVIPGFARTDCKPFEGDQKNAPITWKKQSACNQQRVHLRLWITRAFLYGFEWR